MATVVYRKERSKLKAGIEVGKPWLAQIKRKGHNTFSKAFQKEKDAWHWAREQERSLDITGLPFTIKEYEGVFVSNLVTRYRDKISPTKASCANEIVLLNNFLKRDIAKKSIVYISTKDAADYREERLNEINRRGKKIKPSSLRREVNTLQHIFEIARTEWGYTNLINPFRGLRIKGSNSKRIRRLKDGEAGLLLEATSECHGPNKDYVALAICLAITTGMRLQEIFNLTLEDIGWSPTDPNPFKALDKRRIIIRKSKTDYKTGTQGRTIVMSVQARDFLLRILLLTGKHIKSGKLEIEIFGSELNLFPMTKGAFQQAWKLVKKRAGINDLTFHDLRHEAASRFDELGLTRAEHGLMMGHMPGDMHSRYIHADLKRIQDKLDQPFYDRYKTREEREAIGLPLRGDEIDLAKADYMSDKLRTILEQRTQGTAMQAEDITNIITFPIEKAG